MPPALGTILPCATVSDSLSAESLVAAWAMRACRAVAAAWLLRRHAPSIRVRVVNVVDLMKLQPPHEHPHGLSDPEFDVLFTQDKPIIFAFHGYPWLIHRLTYRRSNHDNLHVRGYKEEGTTTTPFDMVVRNNMDRFQLAIDALGRVSPRKENADQAVQIFQKKLDEHHVYIRQHGQDMPEVQNWKWA